MPGSCRRLLFLSPEDDDNMVLICAIWSMTCWSTKECLETILEFVTCGGCVVASDGMLISILSVSVEAVEMFCGKVLAPQAWHLKPDDFLSPLYLMCDFRK